MQREPTSEALSRRDVLTHTLVGAGAIALGSSFEPPSRSPSAAMIAKTPSSLPNSLQAAPFQLPPLPYAENALEPVMSANTFSFHYGKHHKGYVDTLNKLVQEDSTLAGLDLEALTKKVVGDASKTAVFNNAAQVWNHTFFWNSMRPGGGGAPKGRMLEALNKSFGDYEKFKTAFTDAAKTQFGTGWAWLIAEGDKLAVVKSGDADTPMAHGKKCLLTIDVWEHAYYLDYQNRRPDYIAAYLDKLVNWEFAEKNLA